ncbi:hypothetical protein GCM10023189_20450 [Nibrella saemangeumensis]|uniref:Caspase family p20 domain-containing protein n=1 Tax=Nibrella saemangeumensis TaxID=1084526 RepID=A0ABP8MRM7_9BACT
MQKKSLIIGINNYKHFSVLENCINDAEDMHAFLQAVEFESTLLVDPTQAEIIEAIKQFKESISDDTVSIIFFSGHGLQDEKFNFLVASDSEVRFIEDIKYNCILADDLLIKASKKNLHLVILDACRNNPFYSGNKSSSMGLLKMNAPAGTLIAFSTSPNSTSIERTGERNGVYTKYLLKNMQTANLPAELVFKNTRNDVMQDTSDRQIPWEESSLFGDHFSFIEAHEQTIENLTIDHLLKNESIPLPELMPFLKVSIFETEKLERLILILTLVKISFSNEQEGISSRTVDEDYLNDILFDMFYPKFEERLLKDDTATDIFSNDILSRLTIVKDVNFGYNSLEGPDETFSQIVMNYVKLDDEDGVVCFYLFTKDNEHYLKPVVFTIDKSKIKFRNYTIITGDKVNAITDVYFKMRLPFEKEVPRINNFLTTTTIIEKWTEVEFQKFFKSKE